MAFETTLLESGRPSIPEVEGIAAPRFDLYGGILLLLRPTRCALQNGGTPPQDGVVAAERPSQCLSTSDVATDSPGLTPRAPQTREAHTEPSLDELQRNKLNLEIDELRRWWRRPQVLAGCGPTVITIVGVATATWAGFFDKPRLDFEKSRLSAQIVDLTTVRNSLTKEVEELRRQEQDLVARMHSVELNQRRAESELGTLLSTAQADVDQTSRALENAIDENQELRAALDQASDRTLSAEKRSSDAVREADRLRDTARLLEEQLALLPPHASNASLLLSQEDSRIYGAVFGAGFGSQPGTVHIEIVPSSSVETGAASESAVRSAARLVLKIEPEFINEWKWFRINFYLSPANRLKILELRKRVRSKPVDTDPTDIELGASLVYRARVQTAIGKESNWTSMSLWDRRFGED